MSKSEDFDTVPTQLLVHFSIPAPISDVHFDAAMVPTQGPELSQVIEPFQRYFLSWSTEANIFTVPSSVSEYVELWENFDGTALGSGYDAWGYVYFHDKEKILKTLSDGH